MKTTKVFPALEWLVAMASRIANNRSEPMAGYCTGNVSRGEKGGNG